MKPENCIVLLRVWFPHPHSSMGLSRSQVLKILLFPKVADVRPLSLHTVRSIPSRLEDTSWPSPLLHSCCRPSCRLSQWCMWFTLAFNGSACVVSSKGRSRAFFFFFFKYLNKSKFTVTGHNPCQVTELNCHQDD